MKSKKRKILNSLFALIILGVLAQTLFVSLGGIPVYNSGISGNAVFRDLIDRYQSTQTSTKIIVASEWVLVLLVILYLLIKGKMKLEHDLQITKDIKDAKKSPSYHKSRSETDIDVLYNLLRERKVLRLSAISKMFSVDKKTATDWCEILEEGNLATIYYPFVGDLRITANKEEKKGKEGESKEEDMEKDKKENIEETSVQKGKEENRPEKPRGKIKR